MNNNSKNLSLEQKIDRILELLENMSQNNESMFGDTISDEEMYKQAYEATISAGRSIYFIFTKKTWYRLFSFSRSC